MILSFSLASPGFLSQIIHVKCLTILANQRWPIGNSDLAVNVVTLALLIVCLIPVTTWTDCVCLWLVTIIYSS